MTALVVTALVVTILFVVSVAAAAYVVRRPAEQDVRVIARRGAHRAFAIAGRLPNQRERRRDARRCGR